MTYTLNIISYLRSAVYPHTYSNCDTYSEVCIQLIALSPIIIIA